jgi:hypothetical protein
MASPNFILNNFRWKLLSLLLAGLAWLTIEAEFQKDETRKMDSLESPVITSSHRTFPTIPLVLMTSATDTNRFKTSPLTVSVELSGTAEVLGRLMPGDVEALVDATDVDGETQFRRKIRVNIPQDLRVVVVSATPQYASVERIIGPK